nr:unnamed protein product [Callosobruchus analis]
MSVSLLKKPQMHFGAITFFAKQHKDDVCGSNGLPLTPNSIIIYGKAQILKTIVNPYLCRYLDIIRGKHERTIVVSQYCGKVLSSLIEKSEFSIDAIKRIAYQVLQGLMELHSSNIVHHNLSSENILIENGNIKLFNYGLYYMTDNGKLVSFPIIQLLYTAPEVYLEEFKESIANPKVDIWSLGIILAELTLNKLLWSSLILGQRIRKVLSLLQSSTSVFERIAREHNCYDQYQAIPPDLKEVIEACLNIYPQDRPTAAELLKKEIFKSLGKLGAKYGLTKDIASKSFSNSIPLIAAYMKKFIDSPPKTKPPLTQVVLFKNEYSRVKYIIDCLEIEIEKPSDPINQSMTWSELKRANTLKYLLSYTTKGAVNYISNGFGVRGCKNTSIATPNKQFLKVPREEKRREQWLAAVSRESLSKKASVCVCEDHFDVKSLTKLGAKYGYSKNIASKSFCKSIPLIAAYMKQFIDSPPKTRPVRLPQVVLFKNEYSRVKYIIDFLEIEIEKPSDPVNQSLTWSEFKRAYTLRYLLSYTTKGAVNYIQKTDMMSLLKTYEIFTISELYYWWQLTGGDVLQELKRQGLIRSSPPILSLPQGDIWAALLNVRGDYERQYIKIDKVTPTPTDRQIEVDIPRCHQYNELLSSMEGHKKLKRILKAWVNENTQYVYWQGLDSLTAPFLYLNFNDEAKAFACLSKFVPKYLHNFFLKDNSAVIEEYLAKFSQLIAFHDPVLANHLYEINFYPQLFAIPWFLTLFSHVFPLHKILHLWDKVLLGNSSFSLHIGLSVLTQLRDRLLNSGFNECILLFSDLPEVDIEKSVILSAETFQKTPGSITHREFNRCSVRDSINIPFSSVLFSELKIESIGQHSGLLKENQDRVVVVVGDEETDLEVFPTFLLKCNIKNVCVLHGGFNILLPISPTILASQNHIS